MDQIHIPINYNLRLFSQFESQIVGFTFIHTHEIRHSFLKFKLESFS